MPTIFTHALVAVALGPAFRRTAWPARVWWLGAGCAILPDADVAGLFLGVPLGSMLGHRGLTHSLAFAAVLAAVLTPLVLPRGARHVPLWLYLFLATVSHGVLDAMTNGGIGGPRSSPPSTPVATTCRGARSSSRRSTSGDS